MISTAQMLSGLPEFISALAATRADVLAPLPGLQTDLILAATILFLLLASWGMLMTARSTHGKGESSRRERTPAVKTDPRQLAELPRDR
jgi:hypothetical protein